MHSVGGWFWMQLIVLLLLVVLVFFICAWAVYLKHRRDMALISKGIRPDVMFRNRLLWGLVLFALGIAFVINAYVSPSLSFLFVFGTVFGLIGLALVAGHYLEKRNS